MSDIIDYLQSPAGVTLGWFVVFANVIHAVWLYVMWFFNRKTFDVFGSSIYWMVIAGTSAVMVLIAGFVTFVYTSGYRWDGTYPFMSIYLVGMTVVLVIAGFVALTEYGSKVRQKLQRKTYE